MTVVILLLLFQPLSLAVVLIHAWISDPTDWRLEDYMCTLPEGCSESIAERKRMREQKSAPSDTSHSFPSPVREQNRDLPASQWTPDRDNIAKLEAHVTFPNVQQYARYYLGFLNANTGKPWIKGEMIKPKREGDLPPGIYIVQRLPIVREGTCDVEHVVYVVETAEVILQACGGPPT
jgi:hypothetical protein